MVITCSICNNLIHKKCSKTMGFKIDLKFITNWICSVWRDEIFQFQNCLFDDLIETGYQDYMDTEIDISKIRNEYNFSHTFNENDEDGKLAIIYCQVHCNFYDVNEFKNIIKTLTKKHFSIFHSHICSLHANGDSLYGLLPQLSITFDIVTLTEVWNSHDKNDKFHPIAIEGYHKYNGLPGTS